jgi:voltage-gated potassium channel
MTLTVAPSSAGGTKRSLSLSYQLFMLFLCVYAIVALTLGVLLPVGDEVKGVLKYVDFAVCGIFFVDFLFCLHRAPNRIRYFFTWGWIDLLSSVPRSDAFRVGRIARLLRILRVLRGLRATKVISSYFIGRRAESTLFAVVAVTFTMLVFASIAILNFEAEADGNIKTAEDALWWAATTVTTVGYGDRYPVTLEGRAVAVMLMTVGVGLFGTLSGVVAAWFLVPQRQGTHDEVAELRATVSELKELLNEQRSASRADPQIGLKENER